ncbi:MAG: zinc ribbon domain-containing protein [Armatimonadetes bacterium]|nr:zinc ribbon domain-containing protein [Armatimonadota bacterium]NIM23393.1 zinc ribbon domain-containing protein [Armatimonadota bacterium]NIM67258.1 zinc ribbon domain-containing protein [Armatimonadota bacterium]NIM75756.1 zinc ribbon domain-containing protein [Armatimonadota bacterium]NIN05444.1 zinc ribbon domain-containing protein [Armatimonadota bacterium]
MPVYEYVCKECKRRFSWLKGVVADEGKPVCPRCGSERYRKVISRVSRARSEEDMLDNMADEDFGDLDDPRQAKRFAKRMSKEFGDELGEDFEDEIDAAIEEESEPDNSPEEY